MRRWQGLLAIFLTLGVLGFIVYRLDFAALGRALAGAQYAYLVPLLATTFVFHWVAALQWRLVLSSVKWVRPLWLFGAQMVGALAHGLLHLQVGAVVKRKFQRHYGRKCACSLRKVRMIGRFV